MESTLADPVSCNTLNSSSMSTSPFMNIVYTSFGKPQNQTHFPSFADQSFRISQKLICLNGTFGELHRVSVTLITEVMVQFLVAPLSCGTWCGSHGLLCTEVVCLTVRFWQRTRRLSVSSL